MAAARKAAVERSRADVPLLLLLLLLLRLVVVLLLALLPRMLLMPLLLLLLGLLVLLAEPCWSPAIQTVPSWCTHFVLPSQTSKWHSLPPSCLWPRLIPGDTTWVVFLVTLRLSLSSDCRRVNGMIPDEVHELNRNNANTASKNTAVIII